MAQVVFESRMSHREQIVVDPRVSVESRCAGLSQVPEEGAMILHLVHRKAESARQMPARGFAYLAIEHYR